MVLGRASGIACFCLCVGCLQTNPLFTDVATGNAGGTGSSDETVGGEQNLSLPVTNGLVLHLESDQGVSANGSTVTAWADQSGHGNDLTGSGDPAIVTYVLGDESVISFDGVDDLLGRTSSLNGFPTGNADRTLIYVVRYSDLGFGGFAYGTPTCNDAFGTVVSDTGALTIQGWCPASDFQSSTQGSDAGWMTHGAVLQNDVFAHYSNGNRIAWGTHTFTTVASELVIGGEMTAPPYLDMEVAAVLTYDRALTDTERQEVESYLYDKYLSAVSTD